MSVTRSDEGGIILSDAKRRAVVAILVSDAIERFIGDNWRTYVGCSEMSWDAVADDLGRTANEHLTRAHDIANAVGVDLDELMYALEGDG